MQANNSAGKQQGKASLALSPASPPAGKYGDGVSPGRDPRDHSFLISPRTFPYYVTSVLTRMINYISPVVFEWACEYVWVVGACPPGRGICRRCRRIAWRHLVADLCRPVGKFSGRNHFGGSQNLILTALFMTFRYRYDFWFLPFHAS
jgi:hypothetical protein